MLNNGKDITSRMLEHRLAQQNIRLAELECEVAELKKQLGRSGSANARLNEQIQALRNEPNEHRDAAPLSALSKVIFKSCIQGLKDSLESRARLRGDLNP